MYDEEPSLSAVARARKHAMLPDLLGAVRGRRRRRQAAFAVSAGAAVALLAWLAQLLLPAAGTVGHVGPRRPEHAPPAVVCEVVHNVPGIVARCQVAAVVRAEWIVRDRDAAQRLTTLLVDDKELQQFLRESDRPCGLLEVAGKTLVASAALDPFPTQVAE